MGASVNTAKLERFDRFFDEHFEAMVTEIAATDPSGAVRRTRAGFASAYRFWSKVEDDGDPVEWVRRVIAEDRHHATGNAVSERAGEHRAPAAVDWGAERHRVAALARRQRAVASVVLGVAALVAIGAELFVAHR
jgi:hypothetical protein